MAMANGIDPAGIALSAFSVVMPTILAVGFYIILSATPGGIQRGSNGHGKLVRRRANRNKTNNVDHDAPEEAEGEEIEEVVEEEIEEIVEPEVEEEAAQVPVPDAKRKGKKGGKSQKLQVAEEPVEVIAEEVVVEPEVEEEVAQVPAPDAKRKGKKGSKSQRVEVAEEPVEVVAEVEEEVAEVPVEPATQKKKKNKNKSKAADIEEPEEVAEEPVPVEVVEEVVEEQVVEEVVEVSATQKKKRNKNKSKASEPVPEVAEEAVIEAAVVAEEPVVQEEAVEAAVEEPAEVPAGEEQDEEEAEEQDAGESPEKAKKKKRTKKPSKAALMAQQFRGGQEEKAVFKDPDVYGTWQEFPEEQNGDWAVISKKEVSPKKDKEEIKVVEPAAKEDAPKPAKHEAPKPAKQEAPKPTEVPKAEPVVEVPVVEEAAEEEAVEEPEEAAAEAPEAEAEEESKEVEEEAAEEAKEKEEEDEDPDAEGVDSIDVVYQKRGQVKGQSRAMLKLIEQKTGVQPITEAGGEFTIKGKKSGRTQALQAINDIVNKGYTLLSYENPVETIVPVLAGNISMLIGLKGSTINKLKDSFHVGIKLPEQSLTTNKKAMVEALVAGNADDVEKAVQVINEIVECGFSPLTHPGVVRVEITVDQFQKPFLIGRKGVEIKKIKDQFQVRCDVSADKDTAEILGKKDQVIAAQRHIAMLMDSVEDKIQANRDKAEKAAAEAAKAEEEAAAARAAEEKEKATEADEEEAATPTTQASPTTAGKGIGEEEDSAKATEATAEEQTKDESEVATEEQATEATEEQATEDVEDEKVESSEKEDEEEEEEEK